jgi:DNA primase
MHDRIAIPIHNSTGQLVAYAGRWAYCDTAPPGDEDKYKFPKGFHKSLELFNLHRVLQCRHVFVVEGFFDAIWLHAQRLPTVALMGTSISDAQVALLRTCPSLRHVTVMMDGDDAGRAAAPAVAARLAAHWWVRIVSLPEGAEPNTLKRNELEQLLGRSIG